MNHKQRVEMFIAIKEKMDEVVEIIISNNAQDEFLASYCFGFMTEKGDNKEDSYEFLAGFSAENEIEIEAMFDAMHRCYLENSGNDEEPPTDSIDYWMNIN